MDAEGNSLLLHTFVTWCLQKGPSVGAAVSGLSERDIDWLRTIEFVNRGFVTPALWTALQQDWDKNGGPDDAGDYLRFVHGENVRTNNDIRLQCLRLGEVLARSGLEAVLLKGVTWLFEDGPGRNDRMMRDIDLLIGSGHIAAAHRALIDAGYRTAETIAGESGHIHELPLIKDGEPANVELHAELSTRIELLPAAEMLADTRPVATGLRMPRPEFKIIHNIIHAQIANGDYAGGVISLRDTLDLARLTSNHFDDVDWQGMAEVARRRGYVRQMSAALHKAARFAGAPLPPPFAKDWGGRLHAARCAWQSRIPIVDAMLRPLGILRRALAWERDSYALKLGTDRGFKAHALVNKRRAARIARFLQRAWPRGRNEP